MKGMQFETIDKNGIKTTCDVIATYHDDNTSKDFIVYTDKTFSDDGKLNIYYSLYQIVDNNIKLINITDSNDKIIGLELIKELVNSINV